MNELNITPRIDWGGGGEVLLHAFKIHCKILESFQCQNESLNCVFAGTEISSSIFLIELEVAFYSVYFKGRMGDYTKLKERRGSTGKGWCSSHFPWHRNCVLNAKTKSVRKNILH